MSAHLPFQKERCLEGYPVRPRPARRGNRCSPGWKKRPRRLCSNPVRPLADLCGRPWRSPGRSEMPVPAYARLLPSSANMAGWETSNSLPAASVARGVTRGQDG